MSRAQIENSRKSLLKHEEYLRKSLDAINLEASKLTLSLRFTQAELASLDAEEEEAE